MTYLNTVSGLTPFLDGLTQQINQAAQQNQETRGLIAGGILPPTALPDGYLGRLQAALMPGSQPLPSPAATPAPAPVPGVLGAIQGGNVPPVGQQPPMPQPMPYAAPVASAAPPPVMRQPAQPGADQVPNMGVQGLPSMAAMQGKPGRADLSGLFGGVEKQFNLPAGYLAGTMGIEDPSGDPNATSPTGAKGILQFTSGTAKQYGLTDPTNIVQSAYAGGQLAADNMKALTSALGRPPSAGELYLAHQQGAAGAAALLANPDVPAAQALASAYHGDVGKAAHAISVNGGDPNAPAGAFATKWVSRFGAPGNIGGQPIGGAPATQVASATASPYGGLDRAAFAGAPATPGAAQTPTFAQTGLGQAIASNGGNLTPPGQPGFSQPMPVATAGPAAKVQGDATAFAGQLSVAPAAAAISTATGSYGSAPLMVNGKMMTRDQAENSKGTDHTDYDDAAAAAGLIPSPDAAPVYVAGGAASPAAPAAPVSAPATQSAPGTQNAGSRFAPIQQAPNPSATAAFGVQRPSLSQVQALMANPATRPLGLQMWQVYMTPTKYEFMQTPDGQVVANNPMTGQSKSSFQGAQRLDFREDPNKNLIAINPFSADSKTVVAAEPGTTTIAPADYAKYHIPADFAGVAQLDADNKLHITSASDLAGSGPLASAQQRQQLMQQQGRDLNDPLVQNYIATGQGLAKPTMTGPEERIYNQDSDAVDNLKVAIDQLRQAKAMNSSINTGWAGNALKSANSATLGLIAPESVANTDTYNNIIATAQAAAAKSAVGGRVTQWDEKFFQGIAPNSSNSPTSRAQIIDNQIAVQTQRLQAAQQRLDKMKSGSFFMKNASPQGGAPASPRPSAQQAPAPPQPGAVYKGYVFKGGDPSQASSWQLAQ